MVPPISPTVHDRHSADRAGNRREVREPVAQPLVSIGLPVYNGENFLRTAVTTIVRQSYHNLELIISDNASTDATPSICAELAAHDPRIRVHRNAGNLGAARNYNEVFRLARGKYFKWAAHDDMLDPTFVERSVAVLEAESDVVLCWSRTGRIDGQGTPNGTYLSDPAWQSLSASTRFRSLVNTPHACVAVFGLIRREALASTQLIAWYVGSDRVLLAELALLGRLYEIPETLFFRRDHPETSVRSYPDPRTRVVWFDPRRSPRFSFPEWHLVLGYARAIRGASISLSDSARCWVTVVSRALLQWRPLLADLKYALLGVPDQYE